MTVVVSFYPLEDIARRVGGTDVQVEDLTPPGVEPHDLELSSDQLDEILDADVVLYFGGGFQPAVQDAVQQRDSGQVTVDVLGALGSAVQPPGPSSEGQETSDPHVWLDPKLMQRMVGVVVQALDRADSGQGLERRSDERNHAATAYDRVLVSLDGEYSRGLTGCSSNVIVTTHAAFGYLAARYGLRQEPITGISPEAEPDPARLAQIEDLVRRDHVTTIFTETLVSPRVAQTIARETGAHTAVLDPIEGLTASEQARGADYASIMRRNLGDLRRALGCTGGA
jgi:zinc transport system substrate-binding protein